MSVRLAILRNVTDAGFGRPLSANVLRGTGSCSAAKSHGASRFVHLAVQAYVTAVDLAIAPCDRYSTNGVLYPTMLSGHSEHRDLCT